MIVLDEAQRIKNLQTKTAQAIKKLDSRYAFVLTGTPLENRIDELYSILQFLDPRLLGPLFRFNRDYYELDERGRPVGYRNLDELAERVSSVMLRWRKEDVESELPGRSAKTFFVPMTETQRSFYEDYEHVVARLASIARRRPLTREEFERLQRCLACMRMVCDTPYILEDKDHACPKMDEIERLLPDLLEDPDRKIIVFSEWVRMLSLVREYAGRAGLEFAWHTGEVPQQRSRAEIRRFREDPDCRLFLSSESGGVGLNLQAADTVVNLDLPWNPARLEQRIARAWRKRQTRPVSVINLVSEDTIEHRMLALLDQKRALADAVLDRRGDPAQVKMPNSRTALPRRQRRCSSSPGSATIWTTCRTAWSACCPTPGTKRISLRQAGCSTGSRMQSMRDHANPTLAARSTTACAVGSGHLRVDPASMCPKMRSLVRLPLHSQTDLVSLVPMTPGIYEIGIGSRNADFRRRGERPSASRSRC